MKPQILIPLPTSTDHEYNHLCWPEYANAVIEAGGEPVKLELSATVAELRLAASQADGFLLPGSQADVDPTKYGAERDPATTEADPLREQVDFALLDAALADDKPLLAICFGTQAMNVWRGGTLVQDVTPVPVNHSAGRPVAVAHAAVVLRDSVLGGIVAQEEATATDDRMWRLGVNTSHHQAVGIAGESLRVVARSPQDGVVEAIEWEATTEKPRRSLLLGVQWHPERTTGISATSRAIFQRLVDDAAKLNAAHGSAEGK